MHIPFNNCIVLNVIWACAAISRSFQIKSEFGCFRPGGCFAQCLFSSSNEISSLDPAVPLASAAADTLSH